MMFQEKSRAKRVFLCFVVTAFCAGAEAVRAGVVWYLNDYDGWAAAAGDVHTIDFETLPDGSRSVAGALITPDFNYTSQGVTFSSPVTVPFIAGNIVTGFELRVDSSPHLDPNWIIADPVTPARAVSFEYVDFIAVSLFDLDNQLIASRSVGPSPGILFLGAVSDEPIGLATAGAFDSGYTIGGFSSAPIPEPATFFLIIAGVLPCVAIRARRQSTVTIKERFPNPQF